MWFNLGTMNIMVGIVASTFITLVLSALNLDFAASNEKMAIAQVSEYPAYFVKSEEPHEPATPRKSEDLEVIKPKIVNGSDATIVNNAWQVAILNKYGSENTIWDRQFCGGSIISETWILTAAHCVIGENPKGLMVGAGATTLSTSDLLWDSMGQLENVKSILIHPKYNPRTFENDIALLRISKPFKLEVNEISGISINTISKVLLPPSDTANWWAPPGTLAKISGWGSTDRLGNSYPSTLQEATVQIIDSPGTNSCASWTEFISKVMVCAYANDGGLVSDSCFGDSGGPLTVDQNGRRFILGIVSFGNNECADVDYPGVYTRVAAFSGWIESKTKIKSSTFEFQTFSSPILSAPHPIVGEEISVSFDEWEPVGTQFKYQWFSGDKAIKRATKNTYVVRKTDLGKQIHVKVTGIFPGYGPKQMFSLKSSPVTN